MRHTSTTLALTAALLLAPAAPALAQAPAVQVASSAAVSPVAANDNDKDDKSSGGWGLWGLVGLLGLAGLIPRKKKEHDVPRRNVPGGGPTTGSHPTDPRV